MQSPHHQCSFASLSPPSAGQSSTSTMDATNLEDVRDKLERVLNEMLEHGSQVLDKVYLEMMISHLSVRTGDEADFSALLKSPFLHGWVQRSFAVLVASGDGAGGESESAAEPKRQNAQLYAFTLRLLALLMENEWQFLKILDADVLSQVNDHLTTFPSLRAQPAVKLAHVQVLRAALKHTTGTKWLVTSKTWQRVLAYVLENQTIYVVREALKFLNQFTHTCASDLADEQLCTEILAAITAPLDAAIVIHDSTVRVDSDDLQRTTMPCIKTLCYLMEYCIRLEKRSCLPHILCKVTKIKLHLWRLTDMTKDEQFFKHIIGALALLNFIEFIDQIGNKATWQFAQNQFGLHFFNHMKFCLVHNSAFALLSIAKMYHMLWTGLSGRVPEEIELEGNLIKFENQIITLQLTPIMFSIVKQRQDAVDAEVFDAYIMKLFDISTDHTLRVCYAFRELLTKNRHIVADVACKSIQGILALKALHRERAVYVFQALSYTLKDFAYDAQAERSECGGGGGEGGAGGGERADRKPTGQGPTDGTEDTSDKLLEMPQFLSAILTGVHAMVREHNITWKESIESMCLLNFMLMLLNKPVLTTRLTVQALKLTQLAVEHFLAPNLALLVENLKGSALENLGPTVARRLHDPNWEVRDSAVELLGAMADICVIKFPSFQTHILDHQLAASCVHLAQHDAEAFVRASALNCLCQLVNVKRIWDESLNTFDLMGYCLDHVHLETEGIVRKEFCLLIGEIYRTYKIPNAQFELLFPTMAHLAINDLYWEAKVSALHFWRQVILWQFKYNGVIDGAFPAVTFSRRHKKIVTLTPREIETRLDLILDELQVRGALGVLLECLGDDCDIEVVKLARQIALRIESFLLQYGYGRDVLAGKVVPERPSTAQTTSLTDASATRMANLSLGDQAEKAAKSNSPKPLSDSDAAAQADRVIAAIVSLDDISLLGDTQVEAEASRRPPEARSSPHLDPELFRRVRAVRPMEFIRRIGKLELATLEERRGAWVRKNESFESLLDDMMFSLQIGDANNADCY